MYCTHRFISVVSTLMLGLMLTMPAQAQTKLTTKQASATQDETHVTTQIVTTGDGRKAILKSNWTWGYVSKEDMQPSGPKIEIAQSTLSLETGVVFRNGDIKPVARTDFYILDSSLAKLLNGFQYKNYSLNQFEKISDSATAYFIFSTVSGETNHDIERFNSAWNRIKPHIVQTTKTDFGGKATFKQVPSGEHYVVGYTEMGKTYLVWDVKVDLLPGSNSLTLDQNNAADSGTVYR